MGWRDNIMIQNVKKHRNLMSFFLLSSSWKCLLQDISAYQQDLEKKRGSSSVILRANKGSWTCTWQWGAARVGHCHWDKVLPPLWRKQLSGQKISMLHSLYSNSEERDVKEKKAIKNSKRHFHRQLKLVYPDLLVWLEIRTKIFMPCLYAHVLSLYL